MSRYTEKRRWQKRGLRRQGLLVGWLMMFSLLMVQSGRAALPEELAVWRGAGGVALFQHAAAGSVPELQAFTPEDSGTCDWNAAAMDGRRVLFFCKADFEVAVCTLNENGAPAEWLLLDYSLRGFTPVALEDNRILIQHGSYGELAKIEFDDEGCIVSKKLLSKNSEGWAARGMDANRIILEHAQTGDVAIWATNPKASLFRPYLSFILSPGWTVRDFAEDFVLIQQGETGAVTLVELENGYRAKKHTEPVSGTGNEGWCAVALAQ